jgi:hypothetical protein
MFHISLLNHDTRQDTIFFIKAIPKGSIKRKIRKVE